MYARESAKKNCFKKILPVYFKISNLSNFKFSSKFEKPNRLILIPYTHVVYIYIYININNLLTNNHAV